MTISSIFSLVFKKLSVKTSKALFLIIPIALLTALSLILFSQAANFKKATNDAIFGTIAAQSTVLQITKTQTQGGGGFGGGGNRGADSLFSTADMDTIKTINNVTSSSVNYTLPINLIQSKNLVENKVVDFGSLTVATPEIGALYTTSKFEYTEGQPIPIILNAVSMTEVYEDWGGKDSVTVTRPQRGQPGQNQSRGASFRDQLPFKTQILPVTKATLMDKEFDIDFGGLDAIPTFGTSIDADNITYKKNTAEEIESKINSRKDLINKYWDYTKVSTPLSFKFKVVGYIKSDTRRSMYIPEVFAETLMNKLISNQLTARNQTPIPVAELGSVYRGITYNGLTLNTTQGNTNRGLNSIPGGPAQRQENGATTPITVNAFTIPGLVIESDPNTNLIKDVYKVAEVFATATKTSPNLTVKFNNADNKDQVIRDLNSKGFSYVDTSSSTVFNNIQSTISNILYYTPILFGALIAAVLGLNMAKTVTEGTKEIGIMRALGFTKGNIRSLFATQGIVYTLIGSLIGLLLGLIGNFLIANFSLSKFQELVAKTVEETFGVKPSLELSQFQNFDFNNASKLGLVLLLLTLIVTIFFSVRASNISPVEAIKAD